jgi:hypothetical protein
VHARDERAFPGCLVEHLDARGSCFRVIAIGGDGHARVIELDGGDMDQVAHQQQLLPLAFRRHVVPAIASLLQRYR